MKNQISPEIFQEVTLLGEAFLLGVVLMMVYDVVRFWRHLIRHHALIIVIEDLIFWVIASLCIFYLLFLENSGRVRLYAISGTGLGMCIYYVFWGRRWMKWLDKGVEIVKKSCIFRKKG